MLTLDKICVRIAHRGDLDAILRFLETPEIDRTFVRPLSERDISISERVATKFDNGFWLIAMYESVLVACRACSGITDEKKQVVELSTMAISEPFRRKGLGTLLLKEGVKVAREYYDPLTITVDSWSTNSGMERTALMCGFRKMRSFHDPRKRPFGIQTVEYALDCIKLREDRCL